MENKTLNVYNTIKKLSNNEEDILDVLSEIKNKRIVYLPRKITKVLNTLIFHEDEDIQLEAIFVLAFRLREKSIFYDLVKILKKQEKDLFFLQRTISALGFIVCRNEELKQEAVEILRILVLNKNLNSELRGISYIEILGILNLASKQTITILDEDIKKMKINYQWLKSLYKNSK